MPVDDADRVTCLECIAAGKSADDPKVLFKSLARHLKEHVMNVKEYRAKYGSDVPVGYMLNGLKMPVGGSTPAEPATPLDAIKRHLTAAESKQFDERFAILFGQADEDPALTGPVQDIVLNEIYINRYQTQLANLSKNNSSNSFANQSASIKTLNDLIKNTTSNNLAIMGSLSLTRKQKRAENKTVESSPSKLLTSYHRITKDLQNNPDLLRRQNEDEEAAFRRLIVNLRADCELVPQEALEANNASLVE